MLQRVGTLEEMLHQNHDQADRRTRRMFPSEPTPVDSQIYQMICLQQLKLVRLCPLRAGRRGGGSALSPGRDRLRHPAEARAQGLPTRSDQGAPISLPAITLLIDFLPAIRTPQSPTAWPKAAAQPLPLWHHECICIPPCCLPPCCCCGIDPSGRFCMAATGWRVSGRQVFRRRCLRAQAARARLQVDRRGRRLVTETRTLHTHAADTLHDPCMCSFDGVVGACYFRDVSIGGSSVGAQKMGTFAVQPAAGAAGDRPCAAADRTHV